MAFPRSLELAQLGVDLLWRLVHTVVTKMQLKSWTYDVHRTRAFSRGSERERAQVGSGREGRVNGRP